MSDPKPAATNRTLAIVGFVAGILTVVLVYLALR